MESINSISFKGDDWTGPQKEYFHNLMGEVDEFSVEVFDCLGMNVPKVDVVFSPEHSVARERVLSDDTTVIHYAYPYDLTERIPANDDDLASTHVHALAHVKRAEYVPYRTYLDLQADEGVAWQIEERVYEQEDGSAPHPLGSGMRVEDAILRHAEMYGQLFDHGFEFDEIVTELFTNQDERDGVIMPTAVWVGAVAVAEKMDRGLQLKDIIRMPAAGIIVPSVGVAGYSQDRSAK